MTGETIGEMTAEIRSVNIEKGWRPESGPGENTWGDYVALLHSEISEALEAYRDHRLADATDTRECHLAGAEMCSTHKQHYTHCGSPKPEGVGSELADVLIRLLDMFDVFQIDGMDPALTLDRVAPWSAGHPLPTTFGDHLTRLHYHVSQLWIAPKFEGPIVLSVLGAICQQYSVDLDAEYVRKITYNRTRPFQHGGRTMADPA